jgi:uncharacterized protein YndB with AHSA1/START domain
MAEGMQAPTSAKQRITLERHYKKASVADVWELLTTKEGIEEWWGPDGFSVTVHELDLRVGGALNYAMSATSPPQIEFMKNAGMSVTTEHRGNFTEVEPKTRLAFNFPVDFVPGQATYPIETTVEIFPAADGVRLIVTLDPMHDAHWNDMMVQGWEMELGRLERALEKRLAQGL